MGLCIQEGMLSSLPLSGLFFIALGYMALDPAAMQVKFVALQLAVCLHPPSDTSRDTSCILGPSHCFNGNKPVTRLYHSVASQRSLISLATRR